MTFYPTFHGIGEPKRPMEPGEADFWVSIDKFEQVLDLAVRHASNVCITFDDGNDSDYEIALPRLVERNLPAIFFVSAAKIGEAGYLSSEQLHRLATTPGMSVGSHGMDHVPWPDQNDASLDRELAGSRQLLSEMCGKNVTDAGLPFGRYNRRVLGRLRSHGYTGIYSSDGSEKLTGLPPIPRESVCEDTDMEWLAAMMRGAGPIERLRNEARILVKSLM